MWQYLALALALALARATPIELAHRTLDDSGAVGALRVDAPGVYVAQFRARIDATTLRRAASALGYAPEDYVPRHALLVHFADVDAGRRFVRALDTRLRRLVPLRAADRLAADIDARAKVIGKQAMMAAAPLVAHRNGTSGGARNLHTGRKRVAADAQPIVTLRAHRIGVRNASAAGALAAAVSAARCRTAVRAEHGVAHDFALHDVHCDDAARTADTVVRALGDVAWIDVEEPPALLNRWSVPAVHRAADAERRAKPLAAQGRAGWRPLLGLRGAGQIAAVSDTGVALETCFFARDTADAVPRAAGHRVPLDTGHARIRAYTSGVGGDHGDAGGHGTHVAGTLLGAGTGAAALFDGVAPAARLAFYDLLPDCERCGLAVPLELDETLLRWSYDAGARVHSGSWGAATRGRYNADAAAVDRFAWRERTFLSVFAAGNDGPTADSMTSPAVAKNALAVAATMNGVEAAELVGARGSAAALSGEWLADFSSRGSPTAPLAKPDLAAPGGAYVWSAAYDAPLSGACAPLGDTLLGLEGTSMATPAVAGAALLVREALQKELVGAAGVHMAHAEHAESSTALLERDGAGGLPVRASLVRALLAASARPLIGSVGGGEFRSVAEARAAGGFGRVALDRVLGDAVETRVLSNERAEHALGRVGESRRACVALAAHDADDALRDAELVVQLAYTDYPSTPGTVIGLVNDLDLVVRDASGAALAVNGLAASVAERRSTMERVVVRPARAVDIEVRATQLDFGGAQDYSLTLTLRYADVHHGAEASAPPAQLVVSPLADSAECVVCAAEHTFVPRDACAACGNGRVEPGEQCEPAADGAECCDEASCRWRAAGTLCALDIAECRVRGRCAAGGQCVPDAGVDYQPVAGTCAPVNGDGATAADTCLRSAAQWRDALRADPALGDDADGAPLTLCCTPFAALAARADADVAEPLRHALALEYVAARLDARHAGGGLSSERLLALRDAERLLGASCGAAGLLDADERDAGAHVLARLRETAAATGRPPCAEPVATAADECVVDAAARADLLCSGAPNRYIEAEHRCACSALRHPGEPDCAHLACSGHGASVYDYARQEERCSCLPGWAGSACARCETAAGDATEFLCVGLPVGVRAATGLTHARRAVLRDETAARLSGAFYATRDKALDARPGTAGLDCACAPVGVVSVASFASHRDALEAALDAEVAGMDAYARAEPLLMGASGSGGSPTTVRRSLAASVAARARPALALVALVCAWQ